VFSRASFSAAVVAVVASMAFASPVTAAKPSPVPPATPAPLATIPPEFVPASTQASQGPIQSVAPEAMAAKAKGHGASARQVAGVAASAGCWSRSSWVQQTNLLGWVMYRYNDVHDWCGDGTWVSYVSVYTWATDLMVGVEYDGDDKFSTYGVRWNVWREDLQGRFTAGLTPWGALYHFYPWIEFYVGGGGQTYYLHYGA
jgi:hypothetical protein